MDFTVPLVIDSGTKEWRIGLANAHSPGATIIPSLQDIDHNAVVSNGLIAEFKSSKKAVNYYSKHIKESLESLNMHSRGSNILLSVPQKMSEDYRQRLTEELFETFEFNSIFYVSQPLLAAYSSGFANCVVLDSGYSNTGILAVKGLSPQTESERMLPFGGRDIDRYLRSLCGNKLNAYNEADLHRIKSNYCSLLNGAGKNVKELKSDVTMPDGKKISLREELRQAPEMLFNPSLGGLPEVMPIDQATIIAALKLDENDAYTVLETVVLAGGNVRFPGTGSRMQLGIATRTVPRINRKVVRHRQGTEAVWVGGAIIASTQTYSKICITKKDFEEVGRRIASERWL